MYHFYKSSSRGHRFPIRRFIGVHICISVYVYEWSVSDQRVYSDTDIFYYLWVSIIYKWHFCLLFLITRIEAWRETFSYILSLYYHYHLIYHWSSYDIIYTIHLCLYIFFYYTIIIIYNTRPICLYYDYYWFSYMYITTSFTDTYMLLIVNTLHTYTDFSICRRIDDLLLSDIIHHLYIKCS